MKSYKGLIIKRERVERRLSLKELAKNICSISYLSKIESGSVYPSDEIIYLLMDKLGIKFDKDLEEEAKFLAESSYAYFLSGFINRLVELLKDKDIEKYRATDAGLDLSLLKKFALGDKLELEDSLLYYMSNRQLAIYKMIKGDFAGALEIFPCAYLYYETGFESYRIGDYSSALVYLQKAYDLASVKGYAYLMLKSKLIIGNSYSNQLDVGNMHREYDVAKNLAFALGRNDVLRTLDYNIASTKIEIGDYEEAYKYFIKLKGAKKMELHKLGVVCERLGKFKEAKVAINKAIKSKDSEIREDIGNFLCSLVLYRLENRDYIKSEEYEKLLFKCFDLCKNQLPNGYLVFHLPWIIEWYKEKRQYKKLYELSKEFPKRISLI
ncbi:helix-turn-helix domain-containing protein [Peptoniphilaceae bacterium SGI.131]